MPEDLRKKRQCGGTQFELSAGNLSEYFFQLDFALGAKLGKPLHLIPEQLSHIDLNTGRKLQQLEKESFRFESWIFDSFEHSAHAVGFEVPREECAIFKNRSGEDH